MNLERIPNEDKLSLCRRYYLGGFAFLPFLWLVNVVWFFKEAFLKPVYTEQPQIKSYVKKSALGLLLWVAVLTTWITIFQHYRARWGRWEITSPSPFLSAQPDEMALHYKTCFILSIFLLPLTRCSLANFTTVVTHKINWIWLGVVVFCELMKSFVGRVRYYGHKCTMLKCK